MPVNLCFQNQHTFGFLSLSALFEIHRQHGLFWRLQIWRTFLKAPVCQHLQAAAEGPWPTLNKGRPRPNCCETSIFSTNLLFFFPLVRYVNLVQPGRKFIIHSGFQLPGPSPKISPLPSEPGKEKNIPKKENTKQVILADLRRYSLISSRLAHKKGF